MDGFLSGILDAITGSFQELGEAIISLIKNGFIWLFTEYTSTTTSGVTSYTITGPSAFAYFVFILMGISLCAALVYYLVNMCRRSR